MKKIVFLLTICLIGSLSFAGQDMTFNPDKGKIEFLAKGWPALLKINGKGEGPEGVITVKDGVAAGLLKLKISSFKTGIDLRDDHMKNKYLHVDKFPTAELKLETVALPSNFKGKNKFKGVLKLHGVEKPVEGKFSMKGLKKGTIKLKAEFNIKISDYGIEIPSFKGVTVAEDVLIKINSVVLMSEVVAKSTK